MSVIEFIEGNGDLILENRRAGFGTDVPPRATVPDHTLDVGSEVIDSVTYEFQAFDDGESEP